MTEATLTPGERKIVDLLLQGYDNAAIARRLRITILTLKGRFHHLFTKFGIRDGAKRVRLAVLFYSPKIDAKEVRSSQTFSPRQLQLTELVAAGLTNAEIAKALQTTEQCVKNKLVEIFGELRLMNRVQVALWAKAQQDRGPTSFALSSPPSGGSYGAKVQGSRKGEKRGA
ncbi:MAG: LuxR C-terminal-related transcriptional regulator [Candidatus Sulfotelmatobacter sp.]